MNKPSIYVIDDEVLYTELIEDYCTTLGLECISYSDWNASLIKSLNQECLLLLDLQMPDSDGLDALQTLAEVHFTGTIALISGMDETMLYAAKKYAVHAGLNVVKTLQKPISLEQFKQLTKDYTSQAVGPSSSIAPAGASLSNSDILTGIEQHHFYPVFQPQIDTWSNTVSGAECLARFKHPTLGNIPPNVFIPIIESYGLMDTFTLYLLEQALTAFRTIWEQGQEILFSFNISASSLTKTFCSQIIQRVQSLRVPTHLITLEITESSALTMSEDGLFAISKLRISGFHLSVDDFGTGYSTITQLHELPFTEIKLDQTYVSDIENRETSKAIIAATSGLSRSLHYRCVAEGVEHQQQLDFLTQNNCHIIQGYIFSKPLTIVQFKAYLYDFHTQDINSHKTPSIEGLKTVGQKICFIYDDKSSSRSFCESMQGYISGDIQLAHRRNISDITSDVDQIIICGHLDEITVKSIKEAFSGKQYFLVTNAVTQKLIEVAFEHSIIDVYDYSIYPLELANRLNHYQNIDRDLGGSKNQSQTDSEAVIDALREASQYESLLQFIKGIVHIEDKHQLLVETGNFLTANGYQTAIQLRQGATKYSILSGSNECPLLITKTFNLLESRDKLFQFDSRLVCTQKDTSILFLSIPEDETALERLKDIAITIADVVDEKWHELRSKNLLENISLKIENISNAVKRTQYLAKEEATSLVYNISDEIHLQLDCLDLNTEQEKHLISLITKTAKNRTTDKELNNLSVLIEELENLTASTIHN